MTDTSATASAPVAPAPAPVKPTLLARIKAFFLHSVTILWARFVALVGVVVGFLAAHFFWPGQGCSITGFGG